MNALLQRQNEKSADTMARTGGTGRAASSRSAASIGRLEATAAASPGAVQLRQAQASVDASPRSLAQRSLIGAIHPGPRSNGPNEGGTRVSGPAKRRPIQRRTVGKSAAAPDHSTSVSSNRTGLPDGLKSGIEHLSGLSLDHVRVHHNSSRPAQLNAHAYAQGSEIHVAPGQERHLPHEAWHVVQQAQGRVRPTLQAKGVAINDETHLEHEADVMGGRALVQRKAARPTKTTGSQAIPVAQLTPAEWVASPAIAGIRAISSGFFSTDWKPLKAQIALYQTLAEANIAGRQASLAQMTLLIAQWRANPKHPVTSTNARIHSIHLNLPILENLIAEERAEMIAKPMEPLGGHSHSLARHGPDLTDAQLQNRLTTGVDRYGVPAPADSSSRFDSYQIWLTTRTRAANRVDAAKVNTMAALNVTLTAYANAWHAARAQPPSALKAGAIAAAHALRPAIVAAAAAIANPSPDHLQTAIVNAPNPPMPNHADPVAVAADAVAINAAVQNMPRLRNRYMVVVSHGIAGVGPSFDGTGPMGGPHPGAVAGARQRSTTTIYTPPAGPIATSPAAAVWPIVTHFPSSDPAGISS